MERKRNLLLGAVLLMLFGSIAAPADTNIALGKPVTLVGTFGVLRPSPDWGPGPVAAGSTVTDGLFLGGGTQWQDGTVWWDSQATNVDGAPISANNAIIVNLGGSYKIDGLIIQADNNDEYVVSYLDSANQWQQLWDVQPIDGWGMTDRPVPGDDSAIYSLGTPVVTTELRVTGGPNSDDYYAVSELQAFGSSSVPEPGTMSLALFGLPMAIRVFRRRRG